MSVQDNLEKYINNMSEDEAKEALTDFILILGDTHKSKPEMIDMIVEIYEDRFKSLID
ncbi:hypothetical protein NST02_23410 [Robertmurraya sp. FSL W8-0741]|uniref:hypothetical protein n=1 Tax=Robertmurraya sp. FSL W8-0741 TaxID=2954629 RepID=UPI0030FA1299